MELVYLWVERYKNIHRQGFNFSPRFICDYDGTNLSIKDNVDEDGNKQYIEKFFGDNINVTAIVGKNGSGKSRTLESIISLISLGSNNYTEEEAKFFLVIYDNNYHVKYINVDKPRINDETSIEFCNELPLLYFNYNLDYFEKKEFNQFYHRRDDFATPTVLLPSKKDGKIDIINMDYIIQRNILKFTIQSDKIFENIESFFKVSKFSLSKNENKIFSKQMQSSLSYMGQAFTQDNIKNNILEFIENPTNSNYKNDFKKLNDLYLVKKIYENKDKVSNNTLKNLLKSNPTDIEADDFKEIVKTINSLKSLNEIFESKVKGLEKIEDALKFKNSDIDFSNLLGDEKHIMKDNKVKLDALPPWIDIEFYNDNNIALSSLSYGQKFLNRFIYTLLYQAEKIKNVKDIKSPFLILLDEVELGLHPNWQKEFILFITEVLGKYTDNKFNLIFTSHSPFLLSDLPKENVIFLDTYDKEKTKEKYSLSNTDGLKDGDCINVSKHIDINPFGANIHTLLSDGFFMDGGLMGEFAKNKIQGILNFLNEKKDEQKTIDKSQILPIINGIGEEFLKEKLLRMYDDKFEESKQAKIKRLEEELAELKR